MKITIQTTYSEIKKFFSTAELPNTLDGELMYHKNVKHSVDSWINVIETEFLKLGNLNIKKSKEAKRAKRNLFQMYNTCN